MNAPAFVCDLCDSACYHQAQLAHAVRNGEMHLMKQAEEAREHLLVMWISTIRMQKAFRRRYQQKMKVRTNK